MGTQDTWRLLQRVKDFYEDSMDVVVGAVKEVLGEDYAETVYEEYKKVIEDNESCAIPEKNDRIKLAIAVAYVEAILFMKPIVICVDENYDSEILKYCQVLESLSAKVAIDPCTADGFEDISFVKETNPVLQSERVKAVISIKGDKVGLKVKY